MAVFRRTGADDLIFIRGAGNEPWWVAKDVCDVLDLENVTKALYGLEDDEKSTLTISKGGPERNIISEPGLYSLILRSRKPEANLCKMHRR